MKHIVVRITTKDGPEVLINTDQITSARPFDGDVIKIGLSDGKDVTVYCPWDDFKSYLQAYDLTGE